jgi:hypothetical protein
MAISKNNIIYSKLQKKLQIFIQITLLIFWDIKMIVWW